MPDTVVSQPIPVITPPVNTTPVSTVTDTIVKPEIKPVAKEEVIHTDLNVGKVYSIEGFYFGFNKTDIFTGDIKKLDGLFELLQKDPGLKVQIQAYSDCRGSNSVNRKISLERASSYKKYLVNKGIAANRLSCKGFGTEDPAITCSPCNSCTEDQHRKNRRIEFKVMEK